MRETRRWLVAIFGAGVFAWVFAGIVFSYPESPDPPEPPAALIFGGIALVVGVIAAAKSVNRFRQGRKGGSYRAGVVAIVASLIGLAFSPFMLLELAAVVHGITNGGDLSQ